MSNSAAKACSQARRQSVRHSPWHLNSLPAPPILPPHSGHTQFRMPDTTSELARSVPNLVICIHSPRITTNHMLASKFKSCTIRQSRTWRHAPRPCPPRYEWSIAPCDRWCSLRTHKVPRRRFRGLAEPACLPIILVALPLSHESMLLRL